jgi:hypothetical protein
MNKDQILLEKEAEVSRKGQVLSLDLLSLYYKVFIINLVWIFFGVVFFVLFCFFRRGIHNK